VLRTVADGISDGTLDRQRHPFLLLAAVVSLGTVPQFLARLLSERLPFGRVAQGPELAEELVQLLLGGIGKSAKN